MTNPVVEMVMWSNFPYVLPQDRLTRAREILRDTGWRILPVISDTSTMKFIGVIYRLDLLNVTSVRSDILVSDVVNEPAVTLEKDEKIIDASKKMLRVDEWYAPVLNQSKIIGIFGLERLIEYYLNKHPEKLEHPITWNDERELVYVSPEDEITRLWYLMLKHRYSGIPVVNPRTKQIIGVVTQYDLLKRGFARVELEGEGRPRKVKIREIMVTPPVTIKTSSTYLEAAKLMIERNIGRVFVTDNNRRLIGIIDREDIVRYIHKINA